MPMRASKKAMGSHVGRMIFRSSSKRTIERRLNKVNQNDLRNSLKRKGLSEIKTDDIAKVMSGDHRAGWSQYKIRRVVEALQEVGVAQRARSASQMVTQASRDAQLETKERMKKLARERRKEVNSEIPKETTEKKTSGILDRMRGAIGRANKIKSNNLSGEKNLAEENVANPFETTRMKLQPKIRLPKKEKDDDKNNPYIG